MKKMLAAGFFLFVALLSSPSASAQASLFWCTFTVGQGTQHATNYVNDSLVHADAMSYAEINHAWSAYIRAHYSIPADTLYGRCDVLDPNAPGGPQRYINAMEQSWKAPGQTLIHVNWTYAPAPGSTPPAAAPPGSTTNTMQHRIINSAEPTHPAAPAAPPAPVHAAAPAPPPAVTAPAQSVATAGKAYHCVLYTRQATKDVRYSGGPIVTDAAQPALTAAWNQEVLATYHVTDPHAHGGCQILSGIPANRERAVNSQEENWKRLHAEVIHVNWTSAPGQSFAAATPPPAPAHSASSSSPAHSASAPAAASAALAPLGADPRLAAIPSRIRGMINAEANANESGCRNDLAGYAHVDCRCFAKRVMDYRIEHSSDYQVAYGQADLVGHVTGWAQVSSIVSAAKAGCTQ